MATDQRIEWVDAARGIGMSAVVAGHVVSNDVARQVIFTFHMPFFFLLSGLMFRPTAHVRELLSKRFFTLIVPYVAFLLSVTMLDIAIGTFDGVVSLPPEPRTAVMLIFGGSVLSGAQTVYWFVPCLFLSNITYAVVAARTGGPLRMGTVAIILACYALACLVSYVHTQTGMPRFTPLGIGQLPLAITFFWAGAVVAERPPSLFILFGGALVFVLVAVRAPVMDMKSLVFGTPVVSFLVAIAGSLGLILIARAVVHTGNSVDRRADRPCLPDDNVRPHVDRHASSRTIPGDRRVRRIDRNSVHRISRARPFPGHTSRVSREEAAFSRTAAFTGRRETSVKLEFRSSPAHPSAKAGRRGKR